MAVNMPHTIRSCRECPYLQFQGIRLVGVDVKMAVWICKLLKSNGVSHTVEYEYTQEGRAAADWTIPDTCPLRDQ